MKKIIVTTCLCLASMLTQAQFQTHLLSYTTLGIKSADIDLDGDMDLLSNGLSNLQWQENIGNRLFLSHTITQNQEIIHSAVVCDLDKDGDMDIVTASFNDDRVYWMQNDGNQNFTSNVLSNAISGSVAVDVSDIDGDGDSDVVCAAFDGDKIAWLQNDGSQHFTLSDVLLNFDGPNKVVACDFDSDGDVDFAAASQLDSTILWLENNGSEIFTPHNLITNLETPRFIALADPDNDGDTDILYGSSGGGSGWFSNNAGQFSKVPRTYLDTRVIDCGDLNNDGLIDLVQTNYTEDEIYWVRNTGNQNYVLGAMLDYNLNNISFITIADFDGDGYKDVVGASGFEVKIFWNSSTAAFTTERLNIYLGDARFACHGDFDADGDVDLLAVGYSHVNYYRNDSNTIFSTFPVYAVSSAFAGRQIRAADMDGDGDLDAVYTEGATNQIVWLENNGAGVFTDHQLCSYIDPYAVYPIDFDFDGDMDVVCTKTESASTCAVYWYENDGNQNFSQHLISGVYRYPKDVFPLDYNNDGLMDVLVPYSGTSSSQRVILYINTGSGFTDWTIASPATGATTVFAIDMDGDSDLDLLSGHYTDNDVIWFENPGETPHVIDANITNVTGVTAADFDGDGDIDVAASSVGDNRVNWYRNNGNMAFTKIAVATGIPDPEMVGSADFDGDGKLELYSTCSSTESVAIYHRGAALPPLQLLDCAEPIFSEYIEGSSNNKALEIYNPSKDTIDLSDYTVNVYTNGNGSPNQSFSPAGLLYPDSVFVIAHPSSIPAILALADTTFGFSFNGDDAIELSKNNRTIDLIGKIAQDPGTEWTASGVSTLNSTLTRKSSSSKGRNTSGNFDPSLEWNASATDSYSNLGTHQSICTGYCAPTISISASQDTICAGAPIQFTALTQNEGAQASYQWRIDGNVVGGDSASLFTSAIAANATVNCTLTSSLLCAISPVSSNDIKIKVKPIKTPGIQITASDSILCSSAAVVFNAGISNGGTSPEFIWMKNGQVVGNNASSYTLANAQDNDRISCTLVSSVECATVDSVHSQPITIHIISALTPSITINAGNTSICAGNSINFTSQISAGGSNPTYQWTRNGNPIAGATQSSYSTNTATNNSSYACILTSNLACVTDTVVSSNNITVNVTPILIPVITISSNMAIICQEMSISYTTSLGNQGQNPLFQWKNNGNIIPGATGPSYTTTSLANGNSITCQLTSNEVCVSTPTVTSNAISTTVLPLPVVPITANGNTLSTSSFSLYQWLRNNLPISGALSQSYTATQNGSYRVIGWSSTTGCNDTSNAILLLTIGEESIPAPESFSVQPNPGNGIFNLHFTDTKEKTIEVNDLLGKQIYSGKRESGKMDYRFDISTQAKGIYFLILTDYTQRLVKRIVLE